MTYERSTTLPDPSKGHATSGTSLHRGLTALLAGVTAATVVIACGGSGAKVPATTKATDGGTDGTVSAFATTPPPSGLPPIAKMPPPGVAGSKRASTRLTPALASCSGTKAQSKDPADLVKRAGDGCAATSKMKPVGALLRGQQGDKDAHQENKFHAEANHCYRLYFASDETAKDAVIVLRDSAGDRVAEAPGPSVPEDGVACFTVADDVSVLVGIGSGKGAWAAQVWSD